MDVRAKRCPVLIQTVSQIKASPSVLRYHPDRYKICLRIPDAKLETDVAPRETGALVGGGGYGQGLCVYLQRASRYS
eukprot:2920702-Rhodomonas_salina.5